MAVSPYWTRIRNQDEASRSVGNFDADRTARNTWLAANYTKLSKDPGLFAAATASGMDYARMRRLDTAYQMHRNAQIADNLSYAGLDDIIQTAPQLEAARQIINVAKNFKVREDSFWSRGSLGGTILEGVGDFFQSLFSPILAPLAAGGAAPEDSATRFLTRPSEDPLSNLFAAPAKAAGSGFYDWGRGIGILLGLEDTSEEQRADMRRGGYDPDDWASRYSYYTDLTGGADPVSDKDANDAKQVYTPWKVDVIREIITAGIYVEPDASPSGLSPNAQKMLATLETAGADTEAEKILTRLMHRESMGIGGHFARAVNANPDDRSFSVLAGIVDVAALWYVNPLAPVSAAAKAARLRQYATAATPQGVRDSLGAVDDATGVAKTSAGKALQRNLVINDQIFRAQAKGEAGLDEVASLIRRRDALYKDYAPLQEIMAGMRAGTVQGVFKTIDDFKGEAQRVMARRGDVGAPLLSVQRAEPGARKPLYEIHYDAAGKPTADSLKAAQEKMAEVMADSVFVQRAEMGMPFVRNRLILPGQVRVSSRIAYPLKVMTDKVLNQRGVSVVNTLEKLKGTAAAVDLENFVKAGDTAAIGKQVGDILHETYTKGGLQQRMARSLSRFQLATDRAVIDPLSVNSATHFNDFVKFALPREWSNYLTLKYSQLDPIGREALLRNVWDSMLAARHVRDTAQARAFIDDVERGLNLKVDPAKVGPTFGAPGLAPLKTPHGDYHSPLYLNQLDTRWYLPSFRELLINTERTGMMGLLARASHEGLANHATRVVKTFKVATVSNRLRQWMLEARGFQLAGDPAAFLRTTQARLGVAGRVAEERVVANQALRDARAALEKVDPADLERATLAGDRGFRELLAKEIGHAADSERIGVLAALLDSGVALKDLAHARSALRLHWSYPVDLIRKVRARGYPILAGKYANPEFLENWVKQADGLLVRNHFAAASHTVSGHLAHHAHGNGVMDEVANVLRMADKNIPLQPIKFKAEPKMMGTYGDMGAFRWTDMLNQRMTDPVGAVVMQKVAAAGNIASKNGIGKAYRQRIVDQVWKVLKEDPRAAEYRESLPRALYADGKFIKGDATQQENALAVLAGQMVDDAMFHLGLKLNVPRHADSKDMLLRIGKGDGNIRWEDVAKLPPEARPATAQTNLIVNRELFEGADLGSKIANGVSKYYQFVVSDPLQRLMVQPMLIGSHHKMMTDLAPYAEELIKKGLSQDSVTKWLDNLAWQHSIGYAHRYMDNPQYATYFAHLSNNFFWYERAMEDFMRRMTKELKHDPATFARAYVLTEAAQHSGVTYSVETEDENGNTTTERMITFPGSGWLMKTVNEAMVGLGLADDSVVKIPFYADLSAPVKWLSPSLQDPIGFTTNPILGLPARVAMELFPSVRPTTEDLLTQLEGGQRGMSGQSLWRSLMPSDIGKWLPVFLDRDPESRYGSAMRMALTAMDAAGKIPGPDATAHQRQLAQDQLGNQVINALIIQSLFNSFGPASTRMTTGNVSDIGEDRITLSHRLRGLNSVKSVFFDILEEKSKATGDAEAFTEALAEFIKRTEGGSILNARAYTQGTTEQSGLKSNEEITQWLLDNRSWVKEHSKSTAALAALLPFGGEYYNSLGYSRQVRADVRNYKELDVFYRDMVVDDAYAEVSKLWDAQEILKKSGKYGPNEKANYERMMADFERRNPAWVGESHEQNSVERINNLIGEYREVVDNPNAPAEFEQFKPKLRQMISLWDGYRKERATLSSKQDRLSLMFKYRDVGNAMFKGTPMEKIWFSVRIYEEG